ncbi:hypothetical protein OSTOST_11733 [Ostertagia ostertagi]
MISNELSASVPSSPLASSAERVRKHGPRTDALDNRLQLSEISRGWGMIGKFWNAVSRPFTKTLSQGAATTVYCAASPEILMSAASTGKSCWDDEKNLAVQLARDEHLQNALWEKTDKILDKCSEAKRSQ